jgi:hypothetical protein
MAADDPTLRRSFLVGLAMLGFVALPHGAPRAAPSGNLIANGDFSTERCSGDWSAVSTVPGWTVTRGAPTLVCYSAGSIATPATPPAGAAFLANGPYGDSALSQVIDISAAATAIDAGTVSYTLSGWLGGWGEAAGQAEVTATFLDSYDDAMPIPAELGGVDAAARGGNSELLARSTGGLVPVRARSVLLRVRFTGTAPFQSAAFADQLSFTLSTPVPAPATKRPPAMVPAFDHVFMVMMENTGFSQVIGDTADAPFINSLAARGTLMAAYNGVYHPSDENYLAVAGGDVFVRGPIYWPDIHVGARHIGDELEAIGKTWKVYEQGMGTPCNLNSNADVNYAPDDAPFINFNDIAHNLPRCAAHLFDTTQLATDLQSAATTPNFAWIAADDYYDGELPGNGSPQSLQVQDHWLRRTLSPILNSPAWRHDRSLLILTWDESSDYSNNHVATIVVASGTLVRPGVVSCVPSNHYGTGRTIELALGLSALTVNDRFARPLNEAFSPRAPVPTLSTATTSVAQGARLAFAYATPIQSFATGNQVAIYPAGTVPGQGEPLLLWQPAADTAGSVSFDTTPLAPGAYDAWYLYDDGVTPLAAPVLLQITP